MSEQVAFIEVRGESVAAYHTDYRLDKAYIGGVEITKWAGADAILDIQAELIRLRDKISMEAAEADAMQQWCAMHTLQAGSSCSEAR